MTGIESREPRPTDEGVTLVEVIVAIGLFGLLSTLLLGLALSTSRVTDDTRRMAAVSEESRLAMERMTRELRQANAILGVHLPTSATDPASFTFWTDFNGNGAQDLTASDPEVLTYRWNPTTSRLTLTANDASGTATTRPVLAVSVTDFRIELRSSLWQYDADGDGTTTWVELDASGPPLGDHDGIPDANELEAIDLIAVSMTVLDASHQQTYRTAIDLRNRSQN